MWECFWGNKTTTDTSLTVVEAAFSVFDEGRKTVKKRLMCQTAVMPRPLALEIGIAVLAAMLLLLVPSASAEEKGKEKPKTGGTVEDQMRRAYEEFMKKNPGASGKKNKKGKLVKKINDAEYKDKLQQNVAYIKELYQKAELKFKEESYREAASFYASVIMANVVKSEKLVEEARKRFLEMEDLAKEHLNNADDASLKRDQLRAIEELGLIVKEFPFTKAYGEAQRRLIALKTKPDVAGLVEFAEAEGAEAGGELIKALKGYQAIIDNPRYENTLAAMKAKRKVSLFKQDAALKERLQEERAALAEKEAPRLMSAADNFLKNKMNGHAKEKLEAIIERFPETTYAQEAQKKLDKIP